MRKQIRGTLLLLLATIIWGSAFIAQSVGMDLIGPFTFQAVRCGLAVIFLFPVSALLDMGKQDGKTFLQRWMDKKLWKAGTICGLALFVAASLQQVGLVYTDAGKAGFITAMYIVLVPILGIFRKQKPPKVKQSNLLQLKKLKKPKKLKNKCNKRWSWTTFFLSS